MKKLLLAFLVLATSLCIKAQEPELTPMEALQQRVELQNETLTKLSNLKISGYVQSQFQWGEQSAALRVGSNNVDAAGNGIEAPFNRIGIRRGRLKFVYDDGGIASGTFQLNIIDKPGLSGATVQLKEAFLNIKDPWFRTIAFRGGVFDRPFGNEISYSSSLIESPERSRIINAIFPEECDLGGMLVLQAPSSSPLNFIKFEGGLFAGNAINPETDNKKDFIGHITATKPIGSIAKWGIGASYYNGGVYQTNNNVYSMNGTAFLLNNDAANTGAFAKREYMGIDGQFSVETPLGITQLRGEYILGTQPGNKKSYNSPNRAALPAADDTYIRPISGWYGILVQDIGQTPFSAVVKYDVIDPNTSVSGNEVGASGTNTSSTDIKYSTLGLGALWRINSYLRLQLYYEMVNNETSTALTATSALKDFSKDLKDNTFTARLQFKF
jgi:hypothetical protein